MLGVHMWSKQRDIARSVRDHRQVAVRSCHGPGKTFTAAAIVLWFLYCFPESRVVTTATKWSRVKNLLWHEINLLHARARLSLGGSCLQTQLYLPDGRYTLGLSTCSGQEVPRTSTMADLESVVTGKTDIAEYTHTEGVDRLWIRIEAEEPGPGD